MKTIKSIFMMAAAMLFVACVEDSPYEGPSTIVSVTPDITAPTSETPVTITAEVSGLQAVESATLSYMIGGNKTDVQMTGSGNIWKGVIPPQPDKTTVKYSVTVVNTAKFSTTSNELEYVVGDPPIEYDKLRLNELFGAAATDDGKFIELYNNSDNPIKLKDVVLRKDEAVTWTGIDGEVIPAHGVFAIIGAKNTTPRGISSGFSAKKSVLVELVDPNGNVIDKFQRGEKADGWGNQSLANVKVSWGRVPDGTGKWMQTDPTPGAPNAKSGTEDDTVVQ
ncbi:MAG: lamin tail domain-containing protein [Prevotella sp.]|nr:lamin tail domain-containing protein [Prevotella sp.]